MRYVVCKRCGGYYELKRFENPDNLDRCQCGGELIYFKNRKSLESYMARKNAGLDTEEISSKKKIVIGAVGLIVFILFAVFGLHYLEYSTFTGSVDSISGAKMTPSEYKIKSVELNNKGASIFRDVAATRESANNGLITKDQELTVLKKAKSDLNSIKNEFDAMSAPITYEEFKKSASYTYYAFITGLDYEIQGIEQNNPNLSNTALSYYQEANTSAKYMVDAFNAVG